MAIKKAKFINNMPKVIAEIDQKAGRAVYAAATVLGMLPGAIAYNFLADAFGTPRFYAALAVTLLAFGIPLVWWQKNSASQALGSLKNFGKGSDNNGKEYRD